MKESGISMKFKTLFVTVFFSVLFAILLGVYAQSIANFVNDLFYIPYMITLTATTIISVCLFIVATILEFMILISGKIKLRISSMILTVVLMITVMIGLFVSWWSVFVMAMSWG